jgi:hypothetical protein
MPFYRLRAFGVAIAITVASLAVGTAGTAMAGTPAACLAVIAKYQHIKGSVTTRHAKVIEQQVGTTCSSISVLRAAFRKQFHGAPTSMINSAASSVKDAICYGLAKTTKLCR